MPSIPQVAAEARKKRAASNPSTQDAVQNKKSRSASLLDSHYELDDTRTTIHSNGRRRKLKQDRNRTVEAKRDVERMTLEEADSDQKVDTDLDGSDNAARTSTSANPSTADPSPAIQAQVSQNAANITDSSNGLKHEVNSGTLYSSFEGHLQPDGAGLQRARSIFKPASNSQSLEIRLRHILEENKNLMEGKENLMEDNKNLKSQLEAARILNNTRPLQSPFNSTSAAPKCNEKHCQVMYDHLLDLQSFKTTQSYIAREKYAQYDEQVKKVAHLEKQLSQLHQDAYPLPTMVVLQARVEEQQSEIEELNYEKKILATAIATTAALANRATLLLSGKPAVSIIPHIDQIQRPFAMSKMLVEAEEALSDLLPDKAGEPTVSNKAVASKTARQVSTSITQDTSQVELKQTTAEPKASRDARSRSRRSNRFTEDIEESVLT